MSGDIDTHMRRTDRILVLQSEGKARSTHGLVDSRLFDGTNKLHAIQNPNTGLWTMKYEMGGLPEHLKQTFTSFERLLYYVTNYFKGRNVAIKEVID